MTEQPHSMIEWALQYRGLGWSVIPLWPGEKTPLVTWEPFQRQAPSERDIHNWFRRWPTANLGIVTGAVSGLVVLDVDVGHGGEDSLNELERRHGRLPETVEAKTGGGGRHVYFKHPEESVRNRVAIALGLDIRGDGGYVVAPPSIHPSGNPYVWLPNHGPLGSTPLAAMPDWLVALPTEDNRLGHPVQYWRALVRDGVTEGARNNTIAALTGRLLWHGVDPEIITDLLLCWNATRCSPPLSDREVIETIGSIVRTHRRHQPI